MSKAIIVNFVGLRGGGISYAYEMTKSFSLLNYKIIAIVSSKMEGLEKWKGLDNVELFIVKGYSTKLNFLPNLFYFYFIESRKIKKRLLSEDVAFVYMPMSSFWAPFVYRKLKQYVNVFTFHDVMPHDKKKTISWRMNNYLAKHSEHIVILSECYKEYIADIYKKEDRHIHISEIGNQAYYGEKTEKVDDGVFHLLFYGRITDYKGIDVLGSAYKKVLNDIDNVHLLIAGSGDFEKYAEFFSGIPKDKISIINRWITDDEVCELFRNEKTITVLPYKNATQSGVIPIAMCFKSLVVSTTCSGLKEQFSDGFTGIAVNPNDTDDLYTKLLYCMKNWDSSKKIISEAYEYISHKTWDSIGESLINDIVKIL